ncbi:MAG: hypothetical protein LBH51_00420 [Treponema sp.]|jgi:hypothetical protein|nr:hypothetical protein [Treponema sp.]
MAVGFKKTQFLFFSVLALFINCRSLETPVGLDNSLPESPEEDINGVFPEEVYIKTRTQTFNTYHYYIIRDGRIWYKSIDKTKKPAEWTLFGKTGLPHDYLTFNFSRPKKIVNISADADELIALSDNGRFYRFCFDPIIVRRNNVWLDRQGWPVEEQLLLDGRTRNNAAWSLGKRNTHVLYYEDPFGNQHHNGTMEIATIYLLLEDGQEICYADSGLPSDFSRNYLGPERGAFKSIALSASASTMLVMNDAGEMYTRIADFDIVGCDPIFFKYTYIPYKSPLPGTNYFSNLTEWGLPPEDWRRQPAIPLEGRAAISRFITILQNGQGNGARELRVAGVNGEGETGYWSKAILDHQWEFKKVPLYFPPGALLRSGPETGKRSASLDASFRGYRWNGGERDPECVYEIPNFNILEGSCEFRITRGDETCVLTLHPVELWTYQKRDYLPGRTKAPKMFFTTLDIDPGAFDGLSAEFRSCLYKNYEKHDKALFQYILGAGNNYIFLLDKNDTNSVLFLTDKTMADDFLDFQRTWYIGFADELSAFNSPELNIGGDSPIGGLQQEDLRRKIELNKKLRKELKAKVAAQENAKLLAFGINAGYLPLDGMIRITPLRFIDVPKFRTITKFGQEIVLVNFAYVNTVSDTQIWIYEKIITLLDLRIRVLTKLAEQIGRNEQAVIPAWFSENITDYWTMAGLPAKASGVFVDPRSLRETPAVVSFTPREGEKELFGWYLTIGDSESYTLFVDPQKSIQKIVSRLEKRPSKRAVRLNCTVHINPSMRIMGDGVIEHTLTRLIRDNDMIVDAVISFDGENFTLEVDPRNPDSRMIFRGKAVF